MTKKAEKGKAFLIDAVESQGFLLDIYGNYKKTINAMLHRVKLNKTSYRHEVKRSGKWVKVSGRYYTGLNSNIMVI